MRERVLVVGDGASGLAAAAVIPGALLAPSQPPRKRVASDRVPFTLGPRYVYPSDGMTELMSSVGLGLFSGKTREVRFGFRVGDESFLPEDISPELRLSYYRKSRPTGINERSTNIAIVPDSVASAGASRLDVLRVPYDTLVEHTRKMLTIKKRILDFVPLPVDPNPDEGYEHPTAGWFDRVVYTCPPFALWKGFRGLGLDKLFLRVYADRRVDPRENGWEYSYRPGDDYSWHRETLVEGPKRLGILPSFMTLLEWTLSPTDDAEDPYRSAAMDRVAKEVFDAGLKHFGPVVHFPMAQIVSGENEPPSGKCWKPVGRIAEWKHGLLLSDAADHALLIRNSLG